VTVPEAFNHKEVIIEGATDKIIVPRTVVIPKDGVASVWVVNGGTRPVHLQNGTHVATGQVCTVIEFDRLSKEPSLVGQAQEERMSEDSSEPKLDDDDIPDPHFSFDKEDDFDIAYGQLDFGYNDNDFIVFPEISLDDPPEVSMLTTSGDEVKAGPRLSHLPDKQHQDILSLLANYPRLFSGDKFTIGTVPGIQHHIPTHGTKPLCTRQWRLPEAVKQQIRQECDAMLEAGVIEPSTSPWLSPVVLVKKKDGTVRFCVDYR